MRPVTDTHKVSRAKLSYIIDATAAPVCIIAPISSWAAAVTSSVPEDSRNQRVCCIFTDNTVQPVCNPDTGYDRWNVVFRVDFGPMRTS